MKTNLKRHKFKIFIIALLILYLFIVVRANNNLMSKIENLARLDWELDTQRIKRISFELAEEQPLVGTGEKYVLVDANGDAWLFKVHESPSSFYCNVEESVSYWGKVCGLNIVDVHKIILPINGKMVQGTIQRMIPDVITLHGFNLYKLNPPQISELLKQQVLDYFVDNYGTTGDNFLLGVKTGKIYGIDKDSSFDIDEKVMRKNDSLRCFTGEGVYSDIWNAYLAGKLDIDIEPAVILIDFMSETSKEMVTKTFGPLLSETEKATFNSIEDLWNKKKMLASELIRFYKTMFKKRKEVLKIPNKQKVNKYKKQVFKKLNDEIKEKYRLLKKFNIKKTTVQNEIIVISSEGAWLLIEDKLLKPYSKRGVFQKENYADAIVGLQELRDNSESIAEKIAITLYILRTNELFWKGDHNFSDPFVISKLRVTLHPKSINIDSLKTRYSAVIGKGISQDMEAEFYYLMALIYVLSEEPEKAYDYAMKAQKKGFEIDDNLKERLRKH